MKNKNSLIGQRFGHLTVMERIPVYGNSRWMCRCDCGNLHEAYAVNLKSGRVVSCGCIKRRGKNPADNVEGTRLSALTRKKRKDKTGVKGVSWDKTYKKWRAYIALKGRIKSLGYYKKYEDAVTARRLAEKQVFGPVFKEHKHQIAADKLVGRKQKIYLPEEGRYITRVVRKSTDKYFIQLDGQRLECKPVLNSTETDVVGFEAVKPIR